MGVKVVWQDEMAFEVQQDGHTFLIDAHEGVGGRDKGPRPKGLVLSGLAGCTGMDVISILKKMRVAVDRFAVEVDAELADEHPKRYTSGVVRYRLWGTDMPLKKVRRAVQLSEDTYCGVSAMLKETMTLESEIWVNDVQIPKQAEEA